MLLFGEIKLFTVMHTRVHKHAHTHTHTHTHKQIFAQIHTRDSAREKNERETRKGGKKFPEIMRMKTLIEKKTEGGKRDHPVPCVADVRLFDEVN